MGIEYKIVSCRSANGKCEPVDAVLKIIVDEDITKVKCPRYNREIRLEDKMVKNYECYCGSLDKDDIILNQQDYGCLYKKNFA